jgi:hypothetical protein
MKTYTGFRAALYGLPLFLAPFIDEIVPILREDQWPTPMKCVASGIVGAAALCVGLRAYYDGSYQRAKDAVNKESKV